MSREKSAGAIIFRKEGEQLFYLLLHYPGWNGKNGHWEFARGHIEEGENYEKTVRREVFEETGIKEIKILPGFKEHKKFFFKNKHEDAKKDEWVFKLVTFFVAETKTRDVKLSPEHSGFLWLPIEDAIKQVTYKNSKELLKRANEFVLQKKAAAIRKKEPVEIAEAT
jgi:8-oxo-dGTP pyrophosphatase MutT (NUDIX family)